jgi:hypothetical protein
MEALLRMVKASRGLVDPVEERFVVEVCLVGLPPRSGDVLNREQIQ